MQRGAKTREPSELTKKTYRLQLPGRVPGASKKGRFRRQLHSTCAKSLYQRAVSGITSKGEAACDLDAGRSELCASNMGDATCDLEAGRSEPCASNMGDATCDLEAGRSVRNLASSLCTSGLGDSTCDLEAGRDTCDAASEPSASTVGDEACDLEAELEADHGASGAAGLAEFARRACSRGMAAPRGDCRSRRFREAGHSPHQAVSCLSVGDCAM